MRIVTNKVEKIDPEKLKSIANDLMLKGADVIMLACTDLRKLLSEEDIDLPIVETTTVLENATVREILS